MRTGNPFLDFEREEGPAESWVAYLECRTALAPEAAVVIVHTAPAADYDDEVAAREDLLAGLETP